MLTNRILEHMDRVFGAVGAVGVPPAVAPAYPPLNLFADDDRLYVEAELPGVRADDLDVSVTAGDQLTITGVRRPAGPERANWLRQECGYGRFTRTVTLPIEVDADRVEARFEAGVLTLALPKSEAAKPRRIAVQAGSPSAAPAALPAAH